MKNGFTLVEAIIVMFIFTIIFGALIMVAGSQDRSWRLGQNKLAEQRQARWAVDSISRFLRQANPDWIIEGVHYPVTITGDSRIDFYQPIFSDEGEISTLKKITFKLNPLDSRQLLKKEGISPYTVVANDIESISFKGGCAGCAVFNCTSIASDCPVVMVEVKTKKENEFTLNSKVTLRNTNVVLTEEVEVEEPGAGEF